MALGLPERLYYSLSELEELWGVKATELDQWIMQCSLHAFVWHPLMSAYEVMEVSEGNTIRLTKQLCHIKAGYKRMLHSDYRIMAKQGRVEIREFNSGSGHEHYCLTGEQLGIQVYREDVVIIHAEKKRFEEAYELKARSLDTSPNRCELKHTHQVFSNFKRVSLFGELYHFGTLQAVILQHLYEAAQKDDPWLNGKQLLTKVGSQSFKLANVFTRHRAFKKLVDSDGRGHYRMNHEFLVHLSRSEE